jgi:U4/U6.U5 tri-snRNP-associated protein 1
MRQRNKQRGGRKTRKHTRETENTYFSRASFKTRNIMSEEVIELSVDETNALRAKLGLKPLRVDGGGGGGSKSRAQSKSKIENNDGDEDVVGEDQDEDEDKMLLGRSRRTAHHKPAENTRELMLAKRRIEEAKLKREVQLGLQKLEQEEAVGKAKEDEDAAGSALDWASKMRVSANKTNNENDNKIGKKSSKKKKKKRNQIAAADQNNEEYTADHLKHLKLGHSLNVEHGEGGEASEVVLTLRDESILKMDDHGHTIKGVRGDGGDGDDDDDGNNVLENVSAAEAQRTKDSLRRKRQIELAKGHAGGYAGWDDDEFDELGGIGDAGGMAMRAAGASGAGYGQAPPSASDAQGGAGKKLYSLGDLMERQSQDQATKGSTQLFAARQSAFATNVAQGVEADVSNRIASDVMTPEEMAAEAAASAVAEGRGEEYAAKEAKRKMKLEKKEKKMFKKLEKKEKHDNKKQQRKVKEEDSDEELDGGEGSPHNETITNEVTTKVQVKEELPSPGKKRSRDETKNDTSEDEVVREQRVAAIRRQKFDAVMEKGNMRTQSAFKKENCSNNNIKQEHGDDNDDDDAFLSTALAKARRLKRLKELQQRKSQGSDSTATVAATAANGEGDATAQSVLSSLKAMDASTARTSGPAVEGEDVVKFEFDETREFSRALLARSEIVKRSESRKKTAPSTGGGVEFTSSSSTKVKQAADDKGERQNAGGIDGSGDVEMTSLDADEKMEDLAQNVNVEDVSDDEGAFGSAAQAAPLGRGLAGALSMLKSTGDITGKNAGKEEMRGRAKDERTYEDYEHLDLKNVVKIDLSTATDKDKEFANREINLDYRDSEGRLLTRKEAWRQLCYQFHGHGSSYKNEERRTKQMHRESELRAKQAEAAERGMFGALKATQKATGKAFVVHKTA